MILIDIDYLCLVVWTWQNIFFVSFDHVSQGFEMVGKATVQNGSDSNSLHSDIDSGDEPDLIRLK